MINDRGTIKWTSIMMPEHVKMIQKLWEEDDYKEKPVLDEQQWYENEFVLQEALENDLQVEVKYFKDHDFHTSTGEIKVIGDQLKIGDTTIKLEDIIEVKN